MKSLITSIIGFIIGIVPGFFIVFNSVFSDSNGSIFERLFTFLLVIISYAILGLAFGFVGRKKPWEWSTSISLPAIIILALYSFQEPHLIGLNLFYLCLTFASVWLGSYLGLRLKARKAK